MTLASRAVSESAASRRRLSCCSRRLLEDGLVILALRRRQMAVEIGVKPAKGELAAIGILEPQVAVADDPGAVENSARAAGIRSHRPEDVDDRRGAIRRNVGDDQ